MEKPWQVLIETGKNFFWKQQKGDHDHLKAEAAVAVVIEIFSNVSDVGILPHFGIKHVETESKP